MTGVIPPLPSGDTVDEFTAKKDNVVTVADSNITLTGEQVINGVSLVENDRVLLTAQSDASENGIWLVGSGVYGAWSRPTDFSTGDEAAGTWTHVTQGTNYDESVWFCVTNRTCTIDTDDQEWRNVNEDPVDGFNISSLDEDSSNANTDYIAKHDGSGMEKVKRNDFIRPGVNTLTDGATITINLSNPERIFAVELGGNRTLAVTNATAGDEFTLKLEQDGTGSRTVTWWSTINWPGGSAPTLTSTADKADYFRFICTGTNTYDCILQTQNLSTSAGGSSGLSSDIIANWEFDYLLDDEFPDSVGSLDLVPSAGTPADMIAGGGKNSNCATFDDAESEYLRVAVNAASELNFEDSDFTIALWLNPDTIGSGMYYLALDSLSIKDNGANALNFQMGGTSTNFAGADMTTGAWQLIVCAYDSVNNLMKISRNGATYETVSQTTGAAALSDGYLYVGSSVTPGNYYDGQTDSLTIWGKALSQSEVTELYNSGTGKFYPFT